MAEVRVSIAMATYNGEKYLREQLSSFETQSRLPDELVVCDDGSTDDTVAVLNDFAKLAPFRVRIYQNDENIGYARNFERAISLCTGDLIFLSDQDDVWFDQKVETMAAIMNANPDKLIAINDTEIVHGALERTGLRKSRQFLSLGLTIDSFFTGCCTVLRSEIRALFSPLPAEKFAHDTWIHLLAESLDARLFVDEVLQFYRRYENNASGWVGSSTRKMRFWDSVELAAQSDSRVACAEGIQKLDILERRLDEAAVGTIFPTNGAWKRQKALVAIARKREALERRGSLLRENLFGRWLKALHMYLTGGYKHFSGWRSFVKDLTWWGGPNR